MSEMRELWAIFEDDLEDAAPVGVIGMGLVEIERLEQIWATRKWDGRKLHAMWIVDAGIERENVIRIFGTVPIAIAQRYREYLERRSDAGR